LAPRYPGGARLCHLDHPRPAEVAGESDDRAVGEHAVDRGVDRPHRRLSQVLEDEHGGADERQRLGEVLADELDTAAA
jgi:hypothetical protein